ncbi:carboxypeptidase Y inhibitor [Fusarium falciforme]|nr:carboxypeptidase Y inhibitor [Fusarium falciforme]
MSSAIVAKLNKEDIIKDTVKDLAFEILGELSVSYVDSDDIKLGNAMPMEATQAAPTIKFTPFDKSQLSAEDKLALLMTDPDAPSRTEHKWSEVCHYIITDIPVEYGPGGDIAISGKGVGADSSTFTKVENIISWGYGTPGAGAYDYIKENNLQLVGANYYMVENTTVDFNYDM